MAGLVIAAVAIVAFLVLSRSSPDVPAVDHATEPPDRHVGDSAPAPTGELLSRWLTDWAVRVQDRRFFGRSDYGKPDVLRELVDILKARSKSISLRDHDDYSLLSASSSANEVARTPAIRALIAEGSRKQDFTFESLEPTIFLCDLKPDGEFCRADQGGVPEPLAKWAPRTSREAGIEVVVMRRRVRERLEDLLAVARAAARHSSPPANLDRYRLLTWAWSLDLENLDDCQREPRPGTVCFFAITDLIAAERVAAGWPTSEVISSLERSGARTIERTPFNPFDQAPRWMADGILTLKKDIDREIQTLTASTHQDPAVFDALRNAVRTYCNHENDREVRVTRPGWLLESPD